MTGKISMESWEELLLDELRSSDAVDEQVVTEDFGIEYQDWEELACGTRELERDLHRWELDPASAEDFLDRNRGWRSGPSLRWRHFGH